MLEDLQRLRGSDRHIDFMLTNGLPLTREQYIHLATAPDDPADYAGEVDIPMPFLEHDPANR